MLAIIFWWLDLIIAISMVIITCILFKLQFIDKFTFLLFWIGVGLGFAFETPLFLISQFSIFPIIIFLSPPPFPIPILIISHSLWDGGLFLIGVGLVHLFRKSPHFEGFDGWELLILVAWGQVQAIGIELLGTFGGAWEYVPYWFNPTMFSILGRDFTILIQIIWLTITFIFYFLALRLKNKMSES